MNARLVEASVLLGASALTVWLFCCARYYSAAQVRQQLVDFRGSILFEAASSASSWPEAWIHDEAVCGAVMEHLRRDPLSRACCWRLGPLLHAHQQEVWELLCAEIKFPHMDRAGDALEVLPRMRTPAPEPVVDDLWSWCVKSDNEHYRWRIELLIAGIESTPNGKQMLLRKWQAASDTERQHLVALGIVDPERRWQPAAK